MSTFSPKTVLTFALLASLGLGAAAFSFGRMQAAPGVLAPTTVAVVDIRLAMRMVKEAEALQADLKGKEGEAQKAIKERKDALEAMKAKGQTLTPGTPAYNDLDAQFTEAAIQLDGFQKFQQEKLSRLANLAELTLYRKLCARAAKLAEAKGFDILLDNTFTQENLEKVPASKAGVDRFLNSDRTLLFARKSVELTDDLIAVLNNEFNQRGGAVAPSTQAVPTVPIK